MMNLSLRLGKPEDAEQCGQICYEAFKAIAEHHNFLPDVPSSEVGAANGSEIAFSSRLLCSSCRVRR